MGMAIFGLRKLLLKESIQEKACRSTLGYTQYKSMTNRGVARATVRAFSLLVCLYCELQKP